MKYLKRFNESLLDDIRNKTDKNLSDIKGKVGFGGKNHKFCHECGEKLERVNKFCNKCGVKQEMDSYESETSKKFTIEGNLSFVYQNAAKTGYAKTAFANFTSNNKTLDGTQIMYKGKSMKASMLTPRMGLDLSEIPTYYEGDPEESVKVKITGYTENGKAPKFDNPIIISSESDIEIINQQSNDNYTISGTLTKKGYDLILRSPAKFLDGTKINLMIRDKCNDCTLPLNKEVKIIGTTKNGEKPGFNNPIIVKSPENISVIKKPTEQSNSGEKYFNGKLTIKRFAIGSKSESLRAYLEYSGKQYILYRKGESEWDYKTFEPFKDKNVSISGELQRDKFIMVKDIQIIK